MKPNFVCHLIGHKLTEGYNDCGYRICHRCGFHEYYDYPEPIYCNGGILLRPYYFVRSIYFVLRRVASKLYYSHINKSKLPF